MRTTMLLGLLLALAGCHDEKEVDRTIVYAVDSKISSVTLTTEQQWDDMLDNLCSYAESGSVVQFRNADNSDLTKHASKKEETLVTKDREKMKEWMKKKEMEGKTVTITFDKQSGTYSGRAYAAAAVQSYGCYTGVVTVADNPAMGDVPLPGLVYALRVNADTTLLIYNHGSLLWADNPTVTLRGLEHIVGDTVTLCGSVSSLSDASGKSFLAIEVEEEATGVVMQLKVNLMTMQACGVHIDTLVGVDNLNTAMPFAIVDDEDGNRGMHVVYNPTGDTIFSAVSSWMGGSHIAYPMFETDFATQLSKVDFPGANMFYGINCTIGELRSIEDEVAIDDLSADILLRYLWRAATTSAQFRSVYREGSQIGILAYMPVFGIDDVDEWSAILFVEKRL